MKTKFLHNFLIGVAGFLLGLATLWVFLREGPSGARAFLALGSPGKPAPIQAAIDLRQAPEERPAQSGPHGEEARGEDEDLFAPFAQARKLHEQMEKEMRQGLAGAFDVEEQDIVTKEDEKSFSYEISGVEGGTLSTSVSNGYLTITGETKKETSRGSFHSTFHRMFQLPSGADAARMETISEKDRIVLRFPKKTG